MIGRYGTLLYCRQIGIRWNKPLSNKPAIADKGVTINGLVILTDTSTSRNSTHTNPPGGLASYYRNNVIGGPGAFVMVVENSDSFGDVLVKKLLAEIAQAVPQQQAGN
jgi:Protein of unknown function (DUF1194)